MKRRRPDLDRDRRNELEAFVGKAVPIAKELLDDALRDELVPPLLDAAKVLETRRKRHGD